MPALKENTPGAKPLSVRERLEEVIALGANHLLLNTVSRHVEQTQALAAVVGLG